MNTQAKIKHVTLDFVTASFMQKKKKNQNRPVFII